MKRKKYFLIFRYNLLIGDLKLQHVNFDRLNDIINDSRGKLDMFVNKWGDLSNRVPRTNLLHEYEGLASVMVSIDPEVRIKKFASLHGYEFLYNTQNQGYFNFVENQGINHQTRITQSNSNVLPNSNLIQNNSYYTNNNQNNLINQQSGIQVTTPGITIQGNNLHQQGNIGVINSGMNNNSSNYHRQSSIQVLTPGSGVLNNDSYMRTQQGSIHVINSSNNPSVQNIQQI